jgi:hypothetical protein
MGEQKWAPIPSDPVKYYGSRGEWQGWSHWLGKDIMTSPEDLVSRAIQVPVSTPT